jgi:hypothetical protein
MKTNRNEYLGQLVSTLEFVLIISGNCDFDDVIEASPDKQKKVYRQLCTSNSDHKQQCLSRVLDRLNQDIKDYQHISHFDEVEFPEAHGICLKTSKRDDEHWKYTIGDLIDWVSTKYDLSDYLLADWFKEELEKRVIKNLPNDTDLDKNPDYIRISTLPKVLQLMIEACNEPEYQMSHSTYNEGLVVDKLVKRAEKMNIYLGDNTRTKKGLAVINVKKVITFIQKDKN